VDGSNNGRRRVKSVERRALGAVVFRWRKQSLEFLAERLPAGVLVFVGDRIGEDREGYWPETGEACEYLLLLGSREPLFLLDGLYRSDGGDDVACLSLFAAGDGLGRNC